MQPLEFWQGDFGKEYLTRNQVDWKARVPFWEHICEVTSAESFLDVGCSAGWNMLALRSINDKYTMTGVDVNKDALEQAFTSGLDAAECMASEILPFFGANSADLVVTSGVLIHIPPDDLIQVMNGIKEVSRQWVLAIEYEASQETEVSYRGHSGKLWKRNFGQLYERLGLSLVEYGPAQGYDSCQFWLLEK